MDAWGVRALSCLGLVAAALSGCGERGAAQDTDEAGSDTASLPDECPKQGLLLFEGLSGRIAAAVMFPASRGGANHVMGSCGGDGVDQTYLVTSQKTSYYRLSVTSDGYEPLTVHIHAGDSCHGPELYCETGPIHGFYFMLPEGESVTMVVDTEPGLEIPEQGLRYSAGISWAEAPDEPCLADEFHGCNQVIADALQPCMAGSVCGDFDQVATCHDDLRQGLSACREEFCPDGPDYWQSDCTPACDERRTGCTSDDGCDTNDCAYEWQLCMDACGSCSAVTFDFEYADACELTLPGPPSPLHEDYVLVDIGAQGYVPGEPDAACGDPEAGEVVWASDATLLLCPSACAMFATEGLAQVEYASPPCE